MIKGIVMLAACIIIAGCGTLTTKVYIPEKTHVNQIQWMTDGSCVVKARKGQILFNRSGVKSRLACGYVGVTGRNCPHCWNEVWSDQDQRWHLIDLYDKMNQDGWPRDHYYEYVTSLYWEGIPDGAEVQLELGADWRSGIPAEELKKMLPVGK